MGIKVTVIGSGSVGSTIAYTLAVLGLASEIVMIDINTEKSFGEALDIRQGIPFCPPGTILAGTYEDARRSDIVILTSGLARKPEQTRLELAQENVLITKSIIPEITKYAPNAVYIIVANPVDVLTYQFITQSSIPENRIIGSGTILDTARLRAYIAEHFSVSQQNVHAYVFGEHGDSSFIPWSLANVSNVPVDEYSRHLIDPDKNVYPLSHDAVEQYIRKSGAKIIERKGATFYAVAAGVCHICKCVAGGIDTSMTVSTMMHGEYGITDVALSTLTVVDRNGISGKLTAPLTIGEIHALENSAAVLKKTIGSLQF